MRGSWVRTVCIALIAASSPVTPLLLPLPAVAAGFAVSEQGAAAFGLAGAATARFDLPERGFYNPAAWTSTRGVAASAGLTLVAPRIEHEHPATGVRTRALRGIASPPNAHLSYGFGALAAGLYLGVPFGSSLAWPEGPEWAGRFEITEIGLTAFEIAPGVAYTPHPLVSIAAGGRLVLASVYMARKIDAVSREGFVELGGDARGLGAAVAARLGPIDPLSLAVSYRSRVALRFAGSADFDDIPPELASTAVDGDVRTRVTLPDRLCAGVALTFDRSVLSIDVEYFGWRSFDELHIDFVDERTPDVRQSRQWHDTLAVRAGFEQRELASGLSVRAGFAYDPTPSPAHTLSPSLPDGNRVLATVGTSLALGERLRAHAAYGHVFFLGVEARGSEAFAGRYRASAEVLSVSLSYETQEPTRKPPATGP